MRSRTDIIISALTKLSEDIHTDDGVVNACLLEAAMRLEELVDAGNSMAEEINCSPECYCDLIQCARCDSGKALGKASSKWEEVCK
jgi:hypothetical protein